MLVPRGFLLIALWAAAAGAHAAATPPPFTDDFAQEPCYIFNLRVEKEAATCGYVSVPLRHENKDSPRIRLAVVVIPAADVANRQEDPLFLAQGGPGGSTIGGFAEVLLDDPTTRPTQNRDLVLWDQRGTYFSQPRLVCRETADLPPNADPKLEEDAYRRCGARLAREAGDISAFNSLENARDIDLVRAALGYRNFNFYGVSYGTELGQFLLRERPTALRSVVLDAVVPLGFSLVADVPAVKQQVMVQYAKGCEQSPACAAAYPNLAQRYLALIDRLNKEPIAIPASTLKALEVPGRKGKGTEPAAKAPAKLEVNGKDFEDALYQAIYMREAIPLMPYVVARAEQGDYSFVVNMALLMRASRDQMADGMYMAVVCSEFGDTPESALRFPGVIGRLAETGKTEAQQLLAICRHWQVGLLDKAYLKPVRSDVPTLLLSGRFDPITPPEHADRVAANLARAYRFTFPSGSHGQAFTVPCANRIIARFLDDPAKAPDGSCSLEATPTFYTPDQLLDLPARTPGTATLLDHAAALAAPAFVIALALGLLFSAVPVYSVSEIVRVFRSRPLAFPDGWQGRLILAAPWIPVFCAFLLALFLVVASVGIGSKLASNQMLLLVGALPVSIRAIGWWLVPYLAGLVLMTVTMIVLWKHGSRSRLGRLYYTLLVLAGWSVCWAVVRTRLVGL